MKAGRLANYRCRTRSITDQVLRPGRSRPSFYTAWPPKPTFACDPGKFGERSFETAPSFLYWLPRIPRCGRVNLRTYHVWGKRDAGIFFSRRTRSGRAAALGPRRERAGVPAGFDDREPAGGHGTQASGAPGWARPVGSVRVAQPL